MPSILALNVGSSSLKFGLYLHLPLHIKESNITLLVQGKIVDIGLPISYFSAQSYCTNQEQKNQIPQSIKTSKQLENINYEIAFSFILNYLLTDSKHLYDKQDVGYIAHRVVHGGDRSHPMVITPATSASALLELDNLSELAPLHNHASVLVICTCLNQLAHAKNIVFFDTIFHHYLPAHVYTYPLPYDECVKKRIRKYGFHGLSHKSVTKRAAEYLKVDWKDQNTRFISCHLGSGASVCAVKAGKSVDTSMGLTPLEGLPGTTRSGTIDPSAIFHLSYLAKLGAESLNAEDRKFHLTKAETILNRDSGFRGICGTENFGEITCRIRINYDERAKLAFDIFVDRILQFIGAYYLKLEGVVSALIFTGGIGEKSAELRQSVSEKIKCLGFAELGEKNLNVQDVFEKEHVVEISSGDGQKILVVKTDEEREMAKQLIESNFGSSF